MKIIDFLNNLTITNIRLSRINEAYSHNYPMNIKKRWCHGLLYTAQGAETYIFKDKTINTPLGSVLYIPKGEEYQTLINSEKSVVISVDFEILGESERPFIINFSNYQNLSSNFYKIEREWTKRGQSFYPECKSYLYKIIALLLEELNSFLPSDKFSKISKSLDYLHENFLKSDFRIEKLSEISGLSQRYFESLFKQKYSVSPKEYALNLKIDHAKNLLMDKSLLIKDISLMLGYSDIYHFGKIFKLKTGYLPSEYRNNFH